MYPPKLLIVCEQYQVGEKAELGKAILEACKRIGIKESEMKAQLGTNLIEEELINKEFSTSLTIEPMCSQIGRIIAVGMTAYNKIEIQHIKGLQLERIPQPRSWDDKMREDSISAIGRVLTGWLGIAQNSSKPKTPGFFDPPDYANNSSKTSSTLPRVQTPLAAKPTTDAGSHNSSKPRAGDARNASVPVPSTSCSISETIDLEALETMLKVEVSNSRMQACIFNWSKDGGSLELRNAGLTKVAGLEGLVPILVADNVLKDESKIVEVRAALDKMGYKTPYLMPVREFTMLVRMYQILAKERKLVLQLVV